MRGSVINDDRPMSSPAPWRTPHKVRSRSTSFLTTDGYDAAPSLPRSTAEDARARLARLSAADLSRRTVSRDTDSLSVHSVSSLNLRDELPTHSPMASPSKRQRVVSEGDERGRLGRSAFRDLLSHPSTINEDPSASLLLANGEAPPGPAADPGALTLRKQKSWTDLVKQLAYGESQSQADPAKAAPAPAADPPRQSVEVGTQTEEDEGAGALQSQREKASWFSWSRSPSTTSNLGDLAKPAAVAAPGDSSATVSAAPMLLPASQNALLTAAGRDSLDTAPDIAASPSAYGFRTLIAGRGARTPSRTRVAKTTVPSKREEGVQTDNSRDGASSQGRSSLDAGSPTIAAPPVALSTSRSSWWSRSPAAPIQSATFENLAAEPGAGLLKPPKEPEMPGVAHDESKTEPHTPQPAAGWLSWWGSAKEGEPVETTDAAPLHAPLPERTVSAPPLNPIVDTFPSSRSAWSKYWGGKTAPRPAVAGEMEVMEVDFPAPPATPPISPALLPKDKGGKPSSVRSLPANAPEPVKETPASKPLTASKKASKAALKPNAPNLVLPTFIDSFERPPRSLPPRQGAIAKALSVVNAYLASAPASTPSGRSLDFSERLPKTLKVMNRSLHLERIHRVVIIGISGWYMGQIAQTIVGRPTGTSSRFSSMMTASIREYLKSKGVELPDDGITSIALEGQGKIADRVEDLYKMLTNRLDWIDEVKSADALFVATHSQGAVVSVSLIDRLIQEGHVKGARVTLLSMASISHGPFPYLNASWSLTPYLHYVEGEAARELFTLQDGQSGASKAYRDGMQRNLAAGVRVVLVASCDDQVVPLSSGLFHSLSHPGILRAVFVDSQAFAASDFIVNLVVFAVRLRNAGLSDHDLLPQLSEALAGSLTGVGHSRIYDEKMVYDLAVRYAFETTSTLSAPTHSSSLAPIPALFDSFDPKLRRTNPHYLPWIVRGIVEDQRVRSLFVEELLELRDAFEDWHPVSKALKDVRYQLEPLRMLPRREPPPPAAPSPGNAKL